MTDIPVTFTGKNFKEEHIQSFQNDVSFGKGLTAADIKKALKSEDFDLLCKLYTAESIIEKAVKWGYKAVTTITDENGNKQKVTNPSTKQLQAGKLTKAEIQS